MTAYEKRLGKIVKRLNAATRGPWRASANDSEDGHIIRMADALKSPGHCESAHIIEYEHANYPGEPGWREADANAQFIAHAPSDIAWLVAQLKIAHRAVLEVR